MSEDMRVTLLVIGLAALNGLGWYIILRIIIYATSLHGSRRDR